MIINALCSELPGEEYYVSSSYMIIHVPLSARRKKESEIYLHLVRKKERKIY